MSKLKTTWLLLLLTGLAQAQGELPQQSKDKHMGVATCANGVCHGKSAPDNNSPVRLNEYRVWLSEDDHAGAYKTLLSSQSKAMAKKLGLANAHTAKICLDCHADNVPAEKRGRRFQLTDGVGCEACHGGAERWLADHSENTATHESNIQLGLYPSEKPKQRAQLCLSCHLGTPDKFATHRLMGAGHPRLSFELESFTFNQPAHYQVDADYERRKGAISAVNMWLAGLVYKADQQLSLLQSNRFKQHGLFPELAFYECHACHRPLAVSRLPVETLSQGLPAGTVRLDDAALVMLTAVLQASNNRNHQPLVAGIKRLHQASLIDQQAMRQAAADLQQQLSTWSNQLLDKNYSTAEKNSLRKQLVASAANGLFKDFTSAEQVFLAVETLSIELKDDTSLKTPMDAWFSAVADEDKFLPQQFTALAKKLSAVL